VRLANGHKIYIMRMKMLLIWGLFLSQLPGTSSVAQPPVVYQLPDAYKFDYEVVQSLSSHKKANDTCTIHFYYTKSGDYAAVRMTGKERMKGNLLIVLTREGICTIFDEHNKNITILSIRKFASELLNLTKWIRMDSVMSYMRKKTDGKEVQSAKTGTSKPIGNFTTEEYSVSDTKGHKGSVWIARVDFPTQLDYLTGAFGGDLPKMMGMFSGRMNAHPLFQALTQPHSLVTEVNLPDSTGGKEMNLYTAGISVISTSLSTSGYQVNNYSNLTLPEIFQREMQKRNH
jgi:hypothetical protein